MRGGGTVYMAGISSLKRPKYRHSVPTVICQYFLKIHGGEYRAFSSVFPTSLKFFDLYDWYDACATSGEKQKGGIDDEIKIGILHEFARGFADRPNRTRFR